jgi:hypothetical protein
MNLDRLREVVDAAIPGPWRWSPGDTLEPPSVRGGRYMVVAEILDGDASDAEFIGTFDPPTVTALLDVAEAARAHRHHVTDEWERVNAGPVEPEPWDRWEAERERLIEATAAALDRLREVTEC